jgi:protein-tyrosine phosphatase
MTNQGSFNILILCTANICRSPMAEQMLRAKLQALGVQEKLILGSAGTLAEPGQPMTEFAMQALSESGISPYEHFSRPLDPALLEAANLVLTATEDHKNFAVHSHIRANRFTFTIKEFAELIDSLETFSEELDLTPKTSLPEKLEQLGYARGLAPLSENLDIEDPFGQDLEAYRATRDELDPLLNKIAKWIAA